MSKLSLIIPVLNEEEFFIKEKSFIQSALKQQHEIIIVDGGSTDQSLTYAKKLDCKIILTKPSRGHQLHLGTIASSHKYLVFLHADTKLPKQGLETIAELLNQPNIGWGRFNVSFSNKKLIFKIIAWFMNKRSCLTGIVTGDHTLFIKRDIYQASGGFSDIPIMEDVELSKRLKKLTRPFCLQKAVITSSRKWENNGIIKTIVLMWCIRALFFIGMPAEKLTNLYYE
jgi:rSAM/selenodomain-associated transferase 2